MDNVTMELCKWMGAEALEGTGVTNASAPIPYGMPLYRRPLYRRPPDCTLNNTGLWEYFRDVIDLVELTNGVNVAANNCSPEMAC